MLAGPALSLQAWIWFDVLKTFFDASDAGVLRRDRGLRVARALAAAMIVALRDRRARVRVISAAEGRRSSRWEAARSGGGSPTRERRSGRDRAT
jgi:hypothetical protein